MFDETNFQIWVAESLDEVHKGDFRFQDRRGILRQQHLPYVSLEAPRGKHPG